MAAKMFMFLAFPLYISFYLSYIVSAFSPADHYLINCGSNEAEILDQDHRLFTGDDSRFLTSGRTIQLLNSGEKLGYSSPLYHTARVFKHPARYRFPISDRGTHHLVRLHFHPISSNTCCSCFDVDFHVIANGFVLLRNFRFPKGDDFPLIKEFVIPVDLDKLEIAFIPSGKSNIGFVNAIEVISAPKDLIADVAQSVDGQNIEWINGLLRNGFETVYRVNVGGHKVTPFNDSLWRTWMTDDQFLRSDNGWVKSYFEARIQYQIGGASREVGPNNVYNSARLIRSLANSIPNSNLTLEFAVDSSYSYMIRMHFCDIASVTLGLLYFNVYINGHLAYQNLDLSELANRKLASPFYADFVVESGSSGNLIVNIGPSSMSLSNAVDGLLNGVEIWKMNNSMRSFAGQVSAGTLWRSRKRGFTVLVPLFGAVLLLLGASMFILRRKASDTRWSRLPGDMSEMDLKRGIQFSSKC